MIKKHGGIFGRNPTFNDVDVEGVLTIDGSLVVNGASMAPIYRGTWDASTNTPTLASGVGTQGDFYIVSAGGSTTLDGVSTWGVGDWVLFNGTTWQRIEGGVDGDFGNILISGNTISTTNTNGDLNFQPDGTGEVNIPKVDIDSGAIDGTTIGANAAAAGTFTQLDVDNVRVDGNTISTTDSNGTLEVNPDGTGGVGIGGDTSGVVAGITVSSKFCVKDDQTRPTAGFVHAQNTTPNSGSWVYACRSRGTLDTPAAVQDDDNLATWFVAGHDGTDLALAASIRFDVDGTPGNNDMPGRIVVATTPDGAQTPVEALRIDSAQKVTFAGDVEITGGSVTGITDLAVADGGTGASDEATARSNLGLGNVDNTSDADKPISTATQSALDAKADETITITGGTGLDGGGDLTANRTINLDSASIASLSLADSALQSGDNVSELTNDAAYIDSAGAPVQSVNGETGTVVLDAGDIGYDNTASGLTATDTKAAIDELADRTELVASFTYDSNTTSPAGTGSIPQPLIFNLYDKIRGCILKDDGTVNYYLNATDWSLKAGGGASDLSGADGQVMVEVPAFYYRVTRSGTETTWEISHLPLPSFSLHPAFIVDGAEVSHRYYSAYDASVFKEAVDITGATQADPVVITSNNHGLQTGDKVYIESVGGMTEINDRSFTVTRIDANEFSLDGEDGTLHGAYTSGGTWEGHIGGGNLDNATALVDTTASTGDKLASVKGVYPMVGLQRGEFRTLAANRGSRWRQLDFPLWCAVGMLYVVEYQTFYNQDELGDGNTNGSYVGSSSNQSDSPHTIAGAGDSWGNGSTDDTQPSAGAKPGTAYMKYRGIENQFGNCWNWCDAINVNVSGTGNVHIANNNDRANYADNTASNHTLVTSSLTTGSANIQAFLPVDPYFLAESTGGTSAQYITDRHYGSSSSNRVFLVGGSAGNGGFAGVFAAFATNGSGGRNRAVGGRLAY